MILPTLLPHATDLGGAIAHALTPVANAGKHVTEMAVPVRDFVGGLDSHLLNVGDYFSTIRNSAIEGVAKGAGVWPSTAKHYVEGAVPVATTAGFVAHGGLKLSVIRGQHYLEKTQLRFQKWLKDKHIQILTALNERGSLLTTQSLKLNNWLTLKANALFNRVG